MARAAVKAKQAAARASVETAKPSRKQRKRASGGNPNQDLFFSKLRRGHRWVFLGLALIFAISFAAIGVGSGNGGLGQVFSGLFGTGSDPVAQAQAEIKTNPAKGNLDLADAYVQQHNLAGAVDAMIAYLKINKTTKTNSAAWTRLAEYKQQQGDSYDQQYQQALLTTQLQSPGEIFRLPNKGAGLFPLSPLDQYFSQQNDAILSPLYQNKAKAYQDALGAYQKAATYASPDDLPNLELKVARAAELAGQNKVAIGALQRYIDLQPTSPFIKQFEDQCKALGGQCAPKSKTKTK